MDRRLTRRSNPPRGRDPDVSPRNRRSGSLRQQNGCHSRSQHLQQRPRPWKPELFDQCHGWAERNLHPHAHRSGVPIDSSRSGIPGDDLLGERCHQRRRQSRRISSIAPTTRGNRTRCPEPFGRPGPNKTLGRVPIPAQPSDLFLEIANLCNPLQNTKGSRMSRRVLTDVVWKQLQIVMRAKGCHRWANDRDVMEGILWKLRTGAP